MLRAEKPATYKVQSAEVLENLMKNAQSILMTDFTGMPVAHFDELRRKCFQSGIQFRVAKNRIAKLVLEKLGYTDFEQVLTGPTGFCIGFDDPILPIRLLSDFARERELLSIKGCLLEGRFYGPEDVERLKSIPHRDVLLAQVVGALVSPLSGLVYVLNEIMRSFVGVVDALAQKRGEDGAPIDGASSQGGSMQNIIEAIEKMTVLELVELKKALEEKFGVTAAAPMAMAVAATAVAEPAPQVEEQTEFTVILTSGGDKKIQVIKEVRTITGLGLKEAKDLVDSAPKPIKEGVSKEEAMAIKAKIEEAGGQVDLK